MHDGWEVCLEKPPGRRRRRRVYASINKRGEIAMNEEAFRRIRQPANVTLLYWPAERLIGVKFPVMMDRNHFPVRRYGRDRKMRIVRGARLLKQFDITLEKTLKFVEPELWTLGGVPLLVLPLDGATADGADRA
jgi:hypothetical protein